MSPVVPGRSWQGDRCAPPLHPPSHGSSWISNPSRASRPYRRSITSRAWRSPSPPAPNHGSSELSRSPEPHSQGEFALPAPFDLEGVPAPKTPDHFMETNPSRIGCAPFHGDGLARDQEGSLRATLPWNHPIDQGHFMHLGTPTDPARIGCRQRIGAEPEDHRASP